MGGKVLKRFVPMVAIDVATKQEAISLFDQLMTADPQPIVKIGMELYYGLGQAIVQEAKKRDFKVFLDLKLYDIPHTVQRAMAAIGRLGVDFTTIHAAGGKVVGVIAAFTYGLSAATQNFMANGLKYYAVTDYMTLINVAKEANEISDEHLKSLQEWRNDPLRWSKQHAS